MNETRGSHALSRRVAVVLHLAVLATLVAGPAAAQVVLHDFLGSPLDGSAPSSQALTFDGTYLYGATATGGTSNLGTVFRIAPDGSGYAVLADLAGAPGPVTPRGGVVNDGARLYGVSAAGGANGVGTVYALNFDGSGLVVLHDFQGSPFDLSGPQSRLLVVGTKLFGTASGGGTSGGGGIYSLTTAGGSYTVHADLAGGMGGSTPTGELTSDGTRLYGMIPNGGTASSGFLYTLNLDGSGFSTLYDLAGGTSEGAAPAGGLVWSSGMLYGLTSAGGANGVGVVFSIADTGSGYTTLHDFAGSPFDGAGPTGSLALAGGVLYGTTVSGGTSTLGTVFSIGVGGAGYTVHADLAGAPGPVAPAGGGAPLLLGTDLYGLSEAGGASNLGALFSLAVGPANAVPVANDDLFATYVDMSLSAPAPGVLANDTDGDPQPLWVSFADSVTSLGGSVSVAADGSFTYWPPSATTGLDSFTYVATDGVDSSNVATVTIDVHAGITPTTYADDFVVNGNCTLREAILAANVNVAVDACPAGSALVPDLITLLAGTYTLSLAGADENGSTSGDLDISSDLILAGAGAELTTIDATGLGDRVLHVDAQANEVTIQMVTVTGGSLTVANIGDPGGGGIVNTGGGLFLFSCAVSGNQVVAGPASTSAYGGGVFAKSGSTVIDRSVVAGNQVVDGGIASQSLVGGGLAVGDGASVSVMNSTFSGNSLSAPNVLGEAAGAGIGVAASGALELSFSTVAANSATADELAHGGGLYVADVSPVGFTASSLVAGNSVSAVTVWGGPDVAGNIASLGYNLIQDPAAATGLVGSDLTGVNPLLAPLAVNGGPTATHALGLGSPAVDLSLDPEPPPYDQRGLQRPMGFAADAGAYEEQNPSGCGQGGWAMAPVLGQWHMVAMPCDTEGLPLQDVLGDDLPPANYGVTWSLSRRDALSDQYVTVSPADPLPSGEGLWFKTLETPAGGVLTVTGSPAFGPMFLSLVDDPAGRMNLLGNPFEEMVPWPTVLVDDGVTQHTLLDAATAGLMSSLMWKWNGAAYQSFSPDVPGMEGELQRFESFWVRVFGPGPLSLVVPGGGPFLAPARPPRELAAGEWSLRLIAEGGGMRDPGNQLGQLAVAACGADRFDLAELAPRSDAPYLTIVFPHPEWAAGDADFTTDFRPLKDDDDGCLDAWAFELRSSLVGRPLTLRWEEHGGLGLLAGSTLTHLETGDRQAMLPGGSFTFTPSSEVSRFTVEVDPTSGAALLVDGFESGDASRWSLTVP